LPGPAYPLVASVVPLVLLLASDAYTPPFGPLLIVLIAVLAFIMAWRNELSAACRLYYQGGGPRPHR
jgi:hypothetical protein